MLDGYRLKHLFLKMSYDKLKETCEREGWKIPFLYELKDEELKHDLVWTRSECFEILSDEDIKYGVRLGVCWNGTKEVNINKNHMVHCVVVVKKD